MFNNFSDDDFARVLIVDELGGSSLSYILKMVGKVGVPVSTISDLVNIQRGKLGLEGVIHESYADILEDELVTGGVKYYNKCDELKIVLALFYVEYTKKDGKVDGFDMFRVFRILRSLKKYLKYSRKKMFDFYEYGEYVRSKM